MFVPLTAALTSYVYLLPDFLLWGWSQAVVLVADSKTSLKVTGLGDVLAPSGGVIGEKRTHTADGCCCRTMVFKFTAAIDLPTLRWVLCYFCCRVLFLVVLVVVLVVVLACVI